MPKPPLILRFEPSLVPLLRRLTDSSGRLEYDLLRRASVKDIVEALGIPHTEVRAILRNGEECDFTAIPRAGETFTILAASPDHPVTEPTVLRPEPLPDLRFMFDATINKLGRLLRLTGYDAELVATASLRETALQAAAAKRILLTRNRDLLKCKEVVFGYLLRSEEPLQQFREVAFLYSLDPQRAPFSRCLECNRLLLEVEKEQVLEQLEPLTRKYYSSFKQCPDCGLIFWRGSHHRRMTELLAGLVQPGVSPGH